MPYIVVKGILNIPTTPQNNQPVRENKSYVSGLKPEDLLALKKVFRDWQVSDNNALTVCYNYHPVTLLNALEVS
jgi:hypothetical protein